MVVTRKINVTRPVQVFISMLASEFGIISKIAINSMKNKIINRAKKKVTIR